MVSTKEAMEQTKLTDMQWRYWKNQAQITHIKQHGNNLFFREKDVEKVMRLFNMSKTKG